MKSNSSTPVPKAPKAPEISLEFCLRLARAQAVMTRRLDASLGSVHGLSFTDFQILLYLEKSSGGKLRRVDLAERLSLTASGITRLLLPLEKIGLVERESDPRDARVGYAAVTATGKRLLTNALTTVHSLSQDLLKGRDAKRLAELSEFLGDIAGMNLSNS